MSNKIPALLFGLLTSLTVSSQSDLTLTKNISGNTVHFTLADETPFKNECGDVTEEKERTKCLEKSLRDQILGLINKEYDYSGEMYVWFTVDKKGNVHNIATKGYPSLPEFENDIKIAVAKLDLTKTTYKNRKVNVRCYTRVLPKVITPKK
jgi:hypothetical protein